MTSTSAAVLRELIEAERERFAVPGCAVAVIAGGEVVLCDGFGVRDQAAPVTSHTLFPIASATKTFTAALCALLVDDGALSWDRPVRDRLPSFGLVDPVAGAQATLRDLLCHRTGLARHDLLWYAAGGRLRPADLPATLRLLGSSHGFRERFQYNNLLYALAGELAGVAGGGSYATALRDRILDPLGMRRTTLSVAALAADQDAARGYVAPEPDAALAEVPYVELAAIAPAGGLNACAAELVSWLWTLLGAGPGGGRAPLLPARVLADMAGPAMPVAEPLTHGAGHLAGYGLGLFIEDYRGHRLIQHGGNIDGFSSQVGAIPEAGCAVAVLTNRDGTALRDALPYLIYDRLLGVAPRPHGERMHAAERALARGHHQALRRTATTSAHLPPVRPVLDYVGTYRHPAYGELTVEPAGDDLAALYRELAGPLHHRHLEVFTLMVDLGGVRTPIPLRFHHDLDGDVTAATLSLDTADAPVRFDRVPVTDHLTDEVLDALAGEYRLGPLTARITRRGSGLLGELPQARPAPLEPVRDLVFTCAGARMEFDGDVLHTPLGDFVRDPT